MERGPLRKGKTVKQKKRKLPVLLRSLSVLTSAFLALSVTCVITVNWLDLKSRENNTAPSLFDWYFASLPESVTEEKLHAGDLLLAKKRKAIPRARWCSAGMCQELKLWRTVVSRWRGLFRMSGQNIPCASARTEEKSVRFRIRRRS